MQSAAFSVDHMQLHLVDLDPGNHKIPQAGEPPALNNTLCGERWSRYVQYATAV